MNKSKKVFLLGLVVFLAGLVLFVYYDGINTIFGRDYKKIAVIVLGVAILFVVFRPFVDKILNKIK